MGLHLGHGLGPSKPDPPRFQSVPRTGALQPEESSVGLPSAAAIAAPSPAPLVERSRSAARTALLGASSMVMLRPSWTGACSTTAISDSSPASLSNNAVPRSG